MKNCPVCKLWLRQEASDTVQHEDRPAAVPGQSRPMFDLAGSEMEAVGSGAAQDPVSLVGSGMCVPKCFLPPMEPVAPHGDCSFRPGSQSVSGGACREGGNGRTELFSGHKGSGLLLRVQQSFPLILSRPAMADSLPPGRLPGFRGGRMSVDILLSPPASRREGARVCSPAGVTLMTVPARADGDGRRPVAAGGPQPIRAHSGDGTLPMRLSRRHTARSRR